MTPKQKEQVDILREAMKMNFKKDGYLTPALLVFGKGKDGKDFSRIFGIDSLDNKQEKFFLMGKMVKEDPLIDHVDSVIFISEAWMARLNKEESAKVDRGERAMPIPSEDPNRIEVAILTHMTDTLETSIYSYKMEDKENPDKRKLVKMADEKNVTGFKNLLIDSFWKGLGTLINI